MPDYDGPTDSELENAIEADYLGDSTEAVRALFAQHPPAGEPTAAPTRPEDEPPHKRLRLTLDLEAHDMGDLTARLEGITTDLCVQKGETVDRVSGSYVLKVTCDSDMDEDRYVSELEAWIEKRREGKRG